MMLEPFHVREHIQYNATVAPEDGSKVTSKMPQKKKKKTHMTC